MQKDWFAIFKVKVTVRTQMIKMWQFLLYLLNFWSISSFVVHYYKPECLMEKFECCVHSQDHNKISQCHWVFVQMIASELLNLLLLNLVWWCITVSQIVFQKDWFAVFKVKVTVKDYIIKIWLFNVSSEMLIRLQLNLVWWHIIISWIVTTDICRSCILTHNKYFFFLLSFQTKYQQGKSTLGWGLVDWFPYQWYNSFAHLSASLWISQELARWDILEILKQLSLSRVSPHVCLEEHNDCLHFLYLCVLSPQWLC